MKTWRTLREHPELWDRYFVREKVLKAIRAFFDSEHFHEVETPLLTRYPAAESYVDVFETALLDRQRKPTKAYLYTSPEMSLKKLLVAGIGNCYSLTKAFRNMETQSSLHNPEFTMVEWYKVKADYTEIMNDCERLVLYILKALKKENILMYQDKQIDLTAPWERLSVSQAFKKYADINFDDFLDEKKARDIAQKKGYQVEDQTTWEELYNQVLLNEIESHLGVQKPTILYEFPSAVAALSNKLPQDPRYCKRFELYIAGLELADAYDELTDPDEIEKRFDEQVVETARQGKTSYEYDRDFIDALRVGLPKSAGIALGVDRLIMLMANVSDIADTLFFPSNELFDQKR